MPILHKLFQKLGEDGAFLNSFHETRIILIPKPEKYITRELQTSIYYKYGQINLQQNTNKPNAATYINNIS